MAPNRKRFGVFPKRKQRKRLLMQLMNATQNRVKRTKVEDEKQQSKPKESSIIDKQELNETEYKLEELSSNTELFSQNIEVKSEITIEDEIIHEAPQYEEEYLETIDETSHESHPVKFICENAKKIVGQLQTVVMKTESIEDQQYDNNIKNTALEEPEKCIEETLIEYVRNNAILYNSSNINFNENQESKKTWKEISEKMGLSDTTCKEIWNKLHSSYTNTWKRRQMNPENIASKWRFEEQMSFLEPTLKTKLNGNYECSNSEDDSSVDENPFAVTNTETTLMNDSHGQSDQLPLSVPNGPVRPKISIYEIAKIMQENNHIHSKYLLNVLSLKQKNYAKDESEMFFLTLARNMKKLSLKEQVRLKMEISNMVFQAEYRDIEKSKSSDPAHSANINHTFTMVEDSANTTIYSLKLD